MDRSKATRSHVLSLGGRLGAVLQENRTRQADRAMKALMAYSLDDKLVIAIASSALFDLSESDQAQLMRPEIRQVIRESTPEQALNGVWGWVDDDLAFLRPWGFDVRDVSTPVLIKYGVTDVLVPAAHGEWLAANVPGCVVKLDDDAGHLGSDPEREIAENVHWLRDGIRPAGSH